MDDSTAALDTCEWCGVPTNGVVVTVNGYLHTACGTCARAVVDLLFHPEPEVNTEPLWEKWGARVCNA